MATRRRPGEALTPQERELIEAGAPKPARSQAGETASTQAEPPASNPESETDDKQADMPASKKDDPATETPSKALSVRVTPTLYKALQRACALRKIEGEDPYKVQDVVAAALEDWLKRHPAKG